MSQAMIGFIGVLEAIDTDGDPLTGHVLIWASDVEIAREKLEALTDDDARLATVLPSFAAQLNGDVLAWFVLGPDEIPELE